MAKRKSRTKKIPEMEKPPKILMHAEWDRRFWAWLVDVIVVSAIMGLFTLPVPSNSKLFFGSLTFPFVMLIYWAFLEHYRQQSLGKMALDLRVTNLKGKKPTLVQSFVQSFGKAFLLPLDCLIGWLAMPGEKVRLFNKVSDTIVIEV